MSNLNMWRIKTFAPITITTILLMFLTSTVMAQGTLHVTGMNGGFDTGIIIDNPLSMDWTITLTGTYPDGTVIEHSETIAGFGRFVGSAQQLFPDRMGAGGQLMRVSHISVPISLLLITATYLRPGSTQTTVAPVADGEQWIIRPSGETYTDGIAFVNTGSEPVTVVIEHYDEDGNVIKTDTIAVDLAPGGKVLHVIQRAEGTAYYRVKSTGKGATVSLSFANDGSVIMENEAQPLEENAPTEESLEDEQGCIQIEGENFALNIMSGNMFQYVGSGPPSWGDYQLIQSIYNVTSLQLTVLGGPAIDDNLVDIIWQSYWGGMATFYRADIPTVERLYQLFDRNSGGCK